MSLRLPRPPEGLVEAFEAEGPTWHALIATVIETNHLDAGEEIEGEEASLPQQTWIFGALPVETMPRGAKIDRKFLSAIRTSYWKFFVGFENGCHAEIDFRQGQMPAATYVKPGQDSWMWMIGRATMLWARSTAGVNEARLLEFPWIDVRAVHAVGPEPGFIVDETWVSGQHGVPMEEGEFVDYVLRRCQQKKAAIAKAKAA